MINDQLPDVNLFKVKANPDNLEEVALFFTIGKALDDYIATQKHHMDVRVMEY